MGNLFVLHVTDDQMAPTILAGDTAIVDTSVKPLPNGKDVAVLKVRGNYHICRFTRFGNQILMLHDNGPICVVRDYEVEIIGKVVHGTSVPDTYIPENKENHRAANTVAFH